MPPEQEEFEESIVGDARRARAKMVAECGEDLERLVQELMGEQAKHPERVVNLRAIKDRARKKGA